MPKIACSCGFIIDHSQIPCNDQWLLISDKTYDQFQGNIDAEKLYLEMKVVFKCPICSRLIIFWNGLENPPEIYLKE
ncbi:MAG: hypothetical protein IPP74_06850 [Alphaproteobacteria bacterium]|nr:hypothetical protein [Alphaproteobacteria bacterium]